MSLVKRTVPKNQEEDKTVEISAQMHGTLVFSDPVNLKINGLFTGSLKSKGTLTIGNTAEVQASIEGDNIIIAGKLQGNVHATKMLVLMPTAVLKGDIKTPKLNIVEGAVFQGNCDMNVSVDKNSDYLNIEEVSKYLEIDLKEIESLANTGKIPGTRAGNGWKFERNKIDHWVSSEKVK
jgi:excisionase family DNA binding protein